MVLQIYSARRVGEILKMPHHEVIRRIRRGDIKAQKLDWNYVITREAVIEAKHSEWYKRYKARHLNSAE